MHALSIFPSAGFEQSVTTPVLLGILVSWAFTEMFGWVYEGMETARRSQRELDKLNADLR